MHGCSRADTVFQEHLVDDGGGGGGGQQFGCWSSVDGFPVGDCFLAVNDDFPCGHYIVCLENNFEVPLYGHLGGGFKVFGN